MKRALIAQFSWVLCACFAASLTAQIGKRDVLGNIGNGSSSVSESDSSSSPSFTLNQGTSLDMDGALVKASPKVESDATNTLSSEKKALLAMSTTDYPATPGDIYLLSYIRPYALEMQNIMVEGDGAINLGVFGRMSTLGMSFREVKSQIELLVAKSYPNSNPSLIIKTVGLFSVKVDGEVEKSEQVQAWGLTRLSEIVYKAKTALASIRSVRIERPNAPSGTYDLFIAARDGDLGQDPYVRSGDRVALPRAKLIVKIKGEVNRQGEYQLLPGEGLRELILRYGDGFTDRADKGRVSIVHTAFSTGANVSKILADFDSPSLPDLMNLDEISVPWSQEKLPVAWFEGALGVGINGQSPLVSQRIPYTFFPGDTLAQAVRSMASQFSAVSAISSVYIIRGGEKKGIDLTGFLYGGDFSNDIALAPNDVIIVPFRQFFVSVSGAVRVPGRYPYVPDRTWEYYVGLAGGFDSDRNDYQKFDIIDTKGMNQRKDRFIQPEDTIIAKSNSFLYQFGRISAVITTTLSILSVIIALSK
jgi:protein involved in polysaccharide export with SLBB domain